MLGLDEGDGLLIGGGRDDRVSAEIGEHVLGFHANEHFILDHQNPQT